MQFDSSFYGVQELTREDAEYAGSRYADVREACFKNAYYLKWGQTGEAPLPTYGVTLGRVLKGFLPGGEAWRFLQASGRAVDAGSDLRWGPDKRGYRRLLHPNGISLFGTWTIDQETPYTGYFSQGKKALIVGRYSTCCSETRRGYTRSLSLVGKLYPTADPQHTELLQTANFITQEDLGGSKSLYINDAVLRNAPDTTPLRRGFGLPILLITGLVFKFVDRVPTMRQLYPIAELGKDTETKTRAPTFMQLTVAEQQPRIAGEDIDFREEILRQIYDPNDDTVRKRLVFNIEVTDTGTTHGLLRQRRSFSGWKRIGQIEFTEAVASYNSDFVLSFHHPSWRLDQNEPGTVLRKVRVRP